MISASRFIEPSTPLSAADEDRFFQNLRTSNGTFKLTGHHRLDAVNTLFFEILSDAYRDPLSVSDIGVSSGITTAEWIAEFDRRGIPVRLLASDLVISAYLADLGGGASALLEPNGHLLQLGLRGLGLRTWYRKLDYVTGAALWRAAAIALARRRLMRLGIVDATRGGQPVLDHPRLHGPFALLCRSLLSSETVSIREDDVLAAPGEDLIGRFDVIRIANVLQYCYFDEPQIKTAAANIRLRCRGEGSLVILARNQAGSLDASILRLDGQGCFTLLGRLGSGSEVEAAFTGLTPSTGAAAHLEGACG